MNKLNPLVSIIIPVYNGANFLNQSIDSALNQTYKNIEILVINDGSTDNGETEKVALSYKDRIRYIKKENGGVSSALNLGIENMEGEWFSWLSHDDFYHPQKIENQVDFLNNLIQQQEGFDIKKSIVFCNWELIDENGNLLRKLNQKQNNTSETKELIIRNIRRNYLNGCSLLIPKNAFYECGFFDENYRAVQDMLCWYKMMFNGYKFFNLPQVLVKMRMHKSQVTYKIPDVAKKELEEFLKWVVDMFYNSKYKSFGLFFKLGCFLLEKGETKAAQYSFIKAELINKSASYYFLKFFCSPYYISKFHFRNLLKQIYIKIKVR